MMHAYSMLGCGAAIGGLTLYLFKNPLTKARNAALFIFIMSAIGLPFSFGYLVHCPNVEIAGVNIRYLLSHAFHCMIRTTYA